MKKRCSNRVDMAEKSRQMKWNQIWPPQFGWGLSIFTLFFSSLVKICFFFWIHFLLPFPSIRAFHSGHVYFTFTFHFVLYFVSFLFHLRHGIKCMLSAQPSSLECYQFCKPRNENACKQKSRQKNISQWGIYIKDWSFNIKQESTLQMCSNTLIKRRKIRK